MESFKDFIRSLRFTRLSYFHTLVPLPLVAAILALSRILILVQKMIIEGTIGAELDIEEGIDYFTASMLSLYIVYWLGSTYSIYRLYSKLIDHIVYSSLALYNVCKERNCDIHKLVSTGLERKKIPSPVTAAVINLLTLGVAYPFLLGLFESYLSRHKASEEGALYRSSFTRPRSFFMVFLDIGVTILTLSVYMIYWIYRAVKAFNKHIDEIHQSGYPESPPATGYAIQGKPGVFTVIALLVAFAGIYGIGVLFLPNLYLIMVLGTSFLIPYAAYATRGTSIITQSLAILLLEYVVFILIGVIGFAAYPSYAPMLSEFENQTKQIVPSNTIEDAALGIFLNNVRIALAALIPFFGMLFAGYAIANTGFIYGLILGNLYRQGVEHLIAGLMILIAPHAPPELYSYALSLSIASRVGVEKPGSLALKAIVSILILFIAAVIEAYLIVVYGGIG